jgi:hypothetical protein
MLISGGDRQVGAMRDIVRKSDQRHVGHWLLHGDWSGRGDDGAVRMKCHGRIPRPELRLKRTKMYSELESQRPAVPNRRAVFPGLFGR